jgi:HK97 family phage prohead protease
MKDYLKSLPGSERRFLTGQPIELRAAEAAGKPRKFSGYAALYNSRSSNLGTPDRPFIEIIAPGAFDAVLKNDVRALFNHNPDHVLGRSREAGGTVRLFSDERGLGFEIDVPDTQLGRDLATSVERGDIDQNSFAFRIAKDGDKWVEEAGVITRTIKRVAELFDVSLVTYPAYPDTSVAVRSLDDFLRQQPPPVQLPIPTSPRETGLRIFTR